MYFTACPVISRAACGDPAHRLWVDLAWPGLSQAWLWQKRRENGSISAPVQCRLVSGAAEQNSAAATMTAAFSPLLYSSPDPHPRPPFASQD